MQQPIPYHPSNKRRINGLRRAAKNLPVSVSCQENDEEFGRFYLVHTTSRQSSGINIFEFRNWTKCTTYSIGMSHYVLSFYLYFTSGKLEKISSKTSFFSYPIADFILAPLDDVVTKLQRGTTNHERYNILGRNWLSRQMLTKIESRRHLVHGVQTSQHQSKVSLRQTEISTKAWPSNRTEQTYQTVQEEFLTKLDPKLE